jgi:topoisomerase-4 subunit A
MATDLIDPGEIRDTPLSQALSERYLAYALSTITSRALPDVRDGLKPVQRRILYAMRELKMDPSAGFKKCARVVGDVIGKYHPHGDTAVYDALVRVAQDFAQRYRLVEGQGNFGNIDGDGAAAMRYTECRLTRAAELLLDGIDEDTADFRATYNGEDQEPVVLPGAFPNLLANGTSGIAVGMATSIPPHNVAEICDATLHLIKTPNARIETLLQFLKGPDFPTGGTIVESPEAILEAYKTGRGGFRLRARWSKEEGTRGSYIIVVTEIPYQVQKSKLIEKIAELIESKKLPLLEDVRDESAEDIRLVLEPKSRNVDPDVLMEALYRQTDLETRISLNMNVLDADGVPRVMDLREVLQSFLDHRRVVLVRRTNFRLKKIERRLNVLEGYLIVYNHLEEVIRIIREEDEPKPALMKRFKLNDEQAEAILEMRLRALRRLEEKKLRDEHKALTAEAKGLRKLLAEDGLQWQAIADEMKAVKDEFGLKTPLGKRRTLFGGPPPAIADIEEVLSPREPVTVVCSAKGWIRALKNHVEPTGDDKYKEGDRGRFWIKAETTDRLVIFATSGRFFTLPCDKQPGGRGGGEPVRLLTDMADTDEIAALFLYAPGRKLIVASSSGNGFIVPEDEVIAQTRKGKQVLNVEPGAEAIACVPVEGDHLAVIGENHKLLVFPLNQVPEMTRGRGVRLQKYKDGALCDIKSFKLKEGLTWTDTSGRVHQVSELRDYIGERGQAGRLRPKGFPRTNTFQPR